ncbi:hypothetical protein ACE6H2_027199 [Prunus campanulata]
MVNSEKERFSIAYSLKPSHYTLIKPLEELISEENPAKYRPYNWGKFLTHRKLTNFKKLNVENIQIHHFSTEKYNPMKAQQPQSSKTNRAAALGNLPIST